ncbi:TonB-dependent receptor [Halioglobus maricola]|uniref:TonB-dependent receptor n=1 Tax=Halioglobus maricola TaxID=2601894 RepID=A0A5P9NG63_9GAMM|nr:TonB-dependent receptor [Halioglobus maricola]QFU74772.1 TonB-dependent receptor [Halioglobus maricola]
MDIPLQRTAIVLALSALSATALADHIEELVVTANHDSRTIDISDELVISPDVAQLLKKAPGANVNANGPLTGIPQYRGMYGGRIATSLDGAQLAPSGPNWMDPPLSYARNGLLESLEVYRGIAPVSVAQESIGGAIDAKTQRGDFNTGSEFQVDGQLMGSAQSVNSGQQLTGALFAANNTHKLNLAAMLESGDDAEFADGEITPTEYERERYDIGYGLKMGNHSVQLDYGYNDTGDSGTPALPMDIEYIEGDLVDLTYRFALPGALDVTAAVFASDLEHGMTNYHLRQAPTSGMRWRRNVADSDNLGFKLLTTMTDTNGNWIFGLDGFDSTHNSNIENPNADMFFVVNFNDAEREVLGAFLERQHDFSDTWRAEFGLRYNQVGMNADEVDGTPANMMPPAAALRDAFNNADRDQTDRNVDLVAKAWYRASSTTSWYAGLAQKTRSPSYQERYLWLPLEATAGLADGNTYTGNIELDPEVSHQVEFGMDFSNTRLTLAPRIFYSQIDDYIQGTDSELAPAVMFVRMMNMMNGTSNPDPLQFNNVDAVIYGFDMDWAWQVSDQWSVSGIVNYVRGERDDIEDELYRIAPANASVRLGYAAGDWNLGAEGVFYSAQNQVSETNREQETAGYGLLNLSANWQVSQSLQFAAGVDTVFDKGYADHLAGYNRAANPDIAMRERLPGYGTNIFARVSYSF